MKATSKLLEVLENNISNEELEYAKYLLESIDAREWELLKYKRAFEILKDKGIVEISKHTNLGSFIYQTYGFDRYLDKEEYELLEELLNG